MAQDQETLEKASTLRERAARARRLAVQLPYGSADDVRARLLDCD